MTLNIWSPVVESLVLYVDQLPLFSLGAVCRPTFFLRHHASSDPDELYHADLAGGLGASDLINGWPDSNRAKPNAYIPHTHRK